MSRFRIIDQGQEWRAFTSDKSRADPSRVGGPENPLLNGADLSTEIAGGYGDVAFDESGVAKYSSRRNINAANRALVSGMSEIKQMAERISLPQNIVDCGSAMFKVKVL